MDEKRTAGDYARPRPPDGTVRLVATVAYDERKAAGERPKEVLVRAMAEAERRYPAAVDVAVSLEEGPLVTTLSLRTRARRGYRS